MENKKKYIVISPLFPNDISHVGSYVYDQIKTIIDLSDYDVKVIKVISFFSSEKDYNFKGIEVKIFRVFDFPFFIFPGLFNWINAIRIKQFFKDHNLVGELSVIHAHVCYPSAYLANAISSIVKVKTIAQHHGIDALQLLNGRSRLLTKIQNRFITNRSLTQLNNIDLNISVSYRVQSELHTFNNYNPKAEDVLYNGIDRTKFYSIDDIAKSEKFQIGCVANFWKIKDQISLIKAVELIIINGTEDIELRLIGSGMELVKCKQYVIDKKLELYVYFEKEMKHEKLNTFYNELDLFVLPSYYEALGCVYLEAWATNTPIISIEGQGFAELIPTDETNNLLAKEKSPISLKDKILGEYNRKRSYPFVEKYDIKTTIKEFIDHYL